MRSQLLLVPIAVIASTATPALADNENYMTIEQAQALLFPGATFKPDFLFLSENQYDDLVKTSGVTQWSHEIKAWRVSTGGWFLLDEVPGREYMVNYAVAFGTDGVVRGIEVLACVDRYSQIRNPAWLHQFIGARRFHYDSDAIKIISGTTLSSSHMAEGMKRVLTIHDTLLKPRY